MTSGYKQTDPSTGSGQGNWVIPEDWEVSTIGENSTWMSGGTPRRNNAEFWSGTIPWISGSTLKSAEISTSDQFLTAEAISTGSKMAPVDSTLLLVRGSALHNEIRAGLVVLPVAFNQDVKALVPNVTVAPKFLTYYILAQSDALLKLVSSAGNSAGVLDTKLVQNFKFLKPPFLEQRTIVAALSDADALIEALEQLIAKKRHLKQGTMQELLTGKKRLPGFSGEWEVKAFNEVCWFQEGPGVRSFQFTASGIKLLNGTNIFRGVLNLETTNRFISEREASGAYAHFLADAGDIVIASSGITIERFHEKVAFVSEADLPFCMNTSTIRFKPHSGVLTAAFLYHFLASDNFKKMIGGQATGSAQLNFGPSHVAKIIFSLPPPSEQTAIAAILSDMDTEIAALESNLAKTRSLKQGMMHNLLTGRIRLPCP